MFTLTIETKDTDFHMKKLMGNFRYRLKVREFKSGGFSASYYDEYGGYYGTFPTEMIQPLIKRGWIAEESRSTMEDDPYITYRQTQKGIRGYPRYGNFLKNA